MALPGTLHVSTRQYPEIPETPGTHPQCRMYNPHAPAWRQDPLDIREGASRALLKEWEVVLRILNCTSGVDREAEAPCQSDIRNFAGTGVPGLGRTYPSPDDSRVVPDSSNIRFGRPSPGSHDMIN